MYETGRGVERDYGEAMRWFLMAAEQGDDYSQSHIGYLYEQGLGVARDEKLAAEWYAKAADRGYAWAQMSLGLLYVHGRGVPLDFAKAGFATLPIETRAGLNIIWVGPTRAAPGSLRTRKRPSSGTARRPTAAIRMPASAWPG
jgi:hypothetical protein